MKKGVRPWGHDNKIDKILGFQELTFSPGLTTNIYWEPMPINNKCTEENK